MANVYNQNAADTGSDAHRHDRGAIQIYLLEMIASVLSGTTTVAKVTLSAAYTTVTGAGALVTVAAGARAFTIHNSGPDPLPGSWGDDLASGLGLTFTADAPFEVLPAITFTPPVGTDIEYAVTA